MYYNIRVGFTTQDLTQLSGSLMREFWCHECPGFLGAIFLCLFFFTSTDDKISTPSKQPHEGITSNMSPGGVVLISSLHLNLGTNSSNPYSPLVFYRN